MQEFLDKIADLCSSYAAAVKVAKQHQEITVFSAIGSVLAARVIYGVGPRFYSLFEFYKKPTTQWGSYLLDEPLKVFFRQLNVDRDVVNDKLKFADHCLSNDLATIPVVCTIDVQRSGSTKAVPLVKNRKEWCEHLSSCPEKLFFKLIDGSWGRGAFSATRQADGNWDYCGVRGSAHDLYDFALDRLAGERGWLIQPKIRPHSNLRRTMSPKCLGTLRVVTAQRDGVPEILFAVLRLPVGDSNADNFFHGASGNLIAAVDLKSGELKTGRGSKTKKWPVIMDIDVHPETLCQISGNLVPYWSEVKDVVLRGHVSLSALTTIGWDVAITDEGPLLVEANATYDIDLVQVALKKGLAKDLEFLIKDFA